MRLVGFLFAANMIHPLHDSSEAGWPGSLDAKTPQVRTNALQSIHTPAV
jgi:hypothetical protein